MAGYLDQIIFENYESILQSQIDVQKRGLPLTLEIFLSGNYF